MGSHGYSKAQMCLQKILDIICSIPPNHQQNSKPQPSFHDHRHVLDSSSSSNSHDKPLPAFQIDLNLELTSSPETDQKSSAGIDSKEETESNQEKSAKEENSFEDRRNPNSETGEFELEEGRSLPLVIETGELSSGNGDLERDGLGLRRELGTQEINSTEEPQLVRSRRGRRRVLPCRYKDSVIQPLVRKRNAAAGSRKRQRLKEMMKS